MAGGSLVADGTVIRRHRLRSELGKGIQALRFVEKSFSHEVAGSKTYTKCAGPWPVDVDVKEVVVTAGIVPTDNAGNLLDVFNGTVAANKPIIAQADPDSLTTQVSTHLAVTGNSRVPAGTAISIRVTFAGDDSTTAADLNVRIEVDIPVFDLAATIHTYGAYDDGE